MASNVYFTSMRTTEGISLLDKLRALLEAAGMGNIHFDKKYTAIKMHFGEYGNLAFLRPNYAKVVADFVKERGGLPFLTDCSTLYVGGRKNALDHLDTAYLNGFSPLSTGCHVIIGDGLRGSDDVAVPVPGGEYVKEALIGRAIMDADIFLSLTHFKGHEVAGFGGCVKNIGMGCGSRAGKMDMHGDGKVKVSKSRCIGCKVCAKYCAQSAQDFQSGKCAILLDRCVGCGRCLSVCPVDAIYGTFDAATELLGKKIAEYTAAVLSGRPHFHISLVIDVSPYCDCHAENDMGIVPNVGMFASFDPIALDAACADAVNAQAPVLGSILSEVKHTHQDHFTDVFPDTDWRYQLAHGEKIGLGSLDYTLVSLDQ